MDDVKVSVIVPVYNTEEYLQKCLDSLTNQTLKNIEIICVNDGSTDNSLKILQDNAIKDGRIYILDANITSRSGPRIVEALELVAKSIHPELFK